MPTKVINKKSASNIIFSNNMHASLKKIISRRIELQDKEYK